MNIDEQVLVIRTADDKWTIIKGYAYEYGSQAEAEAWAKEKFGDVPQRILRPYFP